MTIRIMADYHHHCLYESYELLSDRFGWEVYRPIGMEWFEQEYWVHEKPVHGDSVAKQYLQFWGDDKDCGTHWERNDHSHPGRVTKMLTLEQVREMKPEIVLCSLFHNEEGYARLARELGAKYGIQVGNVMTPNRFHLADFAMLSCTKPDGVYPTIPYVTYHQEFSLDDFRFEYPPTDRNAAATWVHSFYWTRWRTNFDELVADVPELDYRTYGHKEEGNPYWAGSLSPCPAVAESMRNTGIAIHFKSHGDGYGHVAHTIFACGKPVIGTASYYQNQLAGPLFVDGVTCMDIQTHSRAEVAEFARRLAHDDEFHRRISENSARRFKEVVNFDEDAAKIKTLLEGVL